MSNDNNRAATLDTITPESLKRTLMREKRNQAYRAALAQQQRQREMESTETAVMRIVGEHAVPMLKADEVKLTDVTIDLGLDSLDHVEIIMALEERFSIEILDDEAEPSEGMTAQAYLDLVNKKMAAKS